MELALRALGTRELERNRVEGAARRPIVARPADALLYDARHSRLALRERRVSKPIMRKRKQPCSGVEPVVAERVEAVMPSQ